ncbi:MAG: sugar phosphate isomerase/epimerase [Planctomycetota bacterium]|nr:sugar phosphate isomerase/epimerase [Planctomycetota bacterium]
MARTSTGSYPIGFRQGWSAWQKDVPTLTSWAKGNEFEVVDVGALEADKLKSIVAAGLKLGTVDLKSWGDLVSPDAGKRKDCAALNAAYIKTAVDAGAKVFFTLVMPTEPGRPRKENFSFAVDGYGQLLTAIRSTGAKIAIEGWPGPSPHFATLACTTADYRAILKDLPDNAAVNFDPSHLIRVGIDPVRFLAEFAPRVAHVHGKDTEIFSEAVQEHGTLQDPTFAGGHGFGGSYWRYTIPGQGEARWTKLFSILKDAKYAGAVSIELEDERFNGSDDGEKRGLIAGRQYLATV